MGFLGWGRRPRGRHALGAAVPPTAVARQPPAPLPERTTSSRSGRTGRSGPPVSDPGTHSGWLPAPPDLRPASWRDRTEQPVPVERVTVHAPGGRVATPPLVPDEPVVAALPPDSDRPTVLDDPPVPSPPVALPAEVSSLEALLLRGDLTSWVDTPADDAYHHTPHPALHQAPDHAPDRGDDRTGRAEPFVIPEPTPGVGPWADGSGAAALASMVGGPVFGVAPSVGRVQLGFRDGTTASLDADSEQAAALGELAQLLSRRD